MQTTPNLSLTSVFRPACWAWSRSWKRAVARAATAVNECSSPAEANEIDVSRTVSATSPTSVAPSAIRKRAFRMVRTSSCIEVENADLGDPVDRQSVAGRCPPDRFRRGRLVDVEGRLVVRADVRLQPRDALLGVAIDERAAVHCSRWGRSDTQPGGKGAFDDVAGHLLLLGSRSPTDRGCGRRPASASVDLPTFRAPVYLSWPARPSRTARALASARVRTASLRSVVVTWWSIVRRETTSRAAICEFVKPCATSARTSTWRAVSSAGFCRVAARGPRGRPR